MAAPLVTQQQVTAAILQVIPKSWKIEVFDDFPSDDDIVRYGIYVSDIHTIERTPYRLAVNLGGNIYVATDQVKIVYVSFQDDTHQVDVNDYISGLVDYTMTGASQQLFDGYHERDFTQELYYGVQSEKHTWTFQLKRLEFQ
jgi:hypothetical protein